MAKIKAKMGKRLQPGELRFKVLEQVPILLKEKEICDGIRSFNFLQDLAQDRNPSNYAEISATMTQMRLSGEIPSSGGED